MTLIDFILKSKLSGYASNDARQKKTYNDGSVGYEIASAHYRYLDRFYGFNPFTGAEYVFNSEDTLLWTMNYFGGVLPDGANAKEIYAFLRSAMALISPEYPFRGPSELENGAYRYENRQYGSFARFHGMETIYENGQKVYELFYHGGSINQHG